MVGKRFLRSKQDLNLRINLGDVFGQDRMETEIGSRHVLCRRNVGLEGAIYSLQVRDKTARFYNDEFAPPSEPSGGLDGSVYVTVSVPVTGDKIHVIADHDSAVMYLDGTASDVGVFLHLNIAWVRQGLTVVWDEGVEQNDLLLMAEGLKVIGFDSTLSLFSHEGRDSKRISDTKTTYRASNTPFADERHDVGCQGETEKENCEYIRPKQTVICLPQFRDGGHEANDGRTRG